MVTLSTATSREIALHSAECRAAEVESPMCECGLFTIAEVMFKMRPNLRVRMPGSNAGT